VVARRRLTAPPTATPIRHQKGAPAMPEADATESKQFHADVPQASEQFFLKGSAAYDWGMQNRLARIFRPASGHTVMLAIDHGYFQGPTTGLERIDLNILPLVPYADALMLTRGALRSMVPPTIQQGFVVRASGGPSILKELSNEQLAMDVDDALRLGASAMAVQVYVGGEFETQTVHNMTRLVDEGYKRGMPVLGVTAVGKDLARDARYLGLATRICAELGAQIVKTYYCAEGFEKVTAGCPVPIVMAGGKKLPELEALEMAYNAIAEGAAGVDMGRNIFQSDAPIAMLRAVRAVVHDGFTAQQAFEVYEAVRRDSALVPAAV
jgi:putative autoinducer-2 (AI-2) aldolase